MHTCTAAGAVLRSLLSMITCGHAPSHAHRSSRVLVGAKSFTRMQVTLDDLDVHWRRCSSMCRLEVSCAAVLGWSLTPQSTKIRWKWLLIRRRVAGSSSQPALLKSNTGLMPAQCTLQQLTNSLSRAHRCAINDEMMTELTSQQESTNSGDNGAIGPRDSRAQFAAGFGVGYDTKHMTLLQSGPLAAIAKLFIQHSRMYMYCGN